MLWKTTSVYQCLIRRTIETIDGMRAAWNAGNLLTTITMARSLIETGAIVKHLTNTVKQAVANQDVDALDKAVMHAGFATRDKSFFGEEEEFKAENILTMIDRMDRSLFKDKVPRLRAAYDFLSEFVHPNHLGILGLYSENFPEKYRVEFGNTTAKKKMILPHIRIALGMVWLVDIAASDIRKLIPVITEFVPK